MKFDMKVQIGEKWVTHDTFEADSSEEAHEMATTKYGNWQGFMQVNYGESS